MPIWHHVAAQPRLRRLVNLRASKCLGAPGHCPSRQCQCASCTDSRATTACMDPHACFQRARELLDQLPPKWDPRQPQPEDWENFNNTLTTKGTLADTFRVFTEGEISWMKNGNHRAGAGGYVREGDQLNFSLRLPDSFEPAPQAGETVAAVVACQRTPNNWWLTKMSDI